MPGRKDSSVFGASYISSWELYRETVDANDLVDTDEHILAAAPVLDLTRNDNGFTNQIWLRLKRTAGGGTVSVSLYMEHNGSWATVDPIVLVEKKDSQDELTLIKWTDLLAAKYRLLLTSIAGGAAWDLHVCHS